jgi:toxin ParE1/3/4
MRIVLSAAAEADAAEIWAYIAQDNPGAADQLLDRFDKLFRTIALQPLMGKSVDELAVNLRFIPFGNYSIFYRAVESSLEIVRILHTARDITAEFFQQ